MQGGSATNRSPPQALEHLNRDHYWRLRASNNDGDAVPTLRLGYRPEVVVFLAQGATPYALLAGSARAQRTEAPLPQLGALLAAWKFSGRIDHDARELRDVRAARDRIREVWGSDEQTSVDWVNDTLVRARAVPRLVDHDDLGWHIHAVPQDAPLATRMAVEARRDPATRVGALSRIGGQLGINPETLRNLVNQAEIDKGHGRVP